RRAEEIKDLDRLGSELSSLLDGIYRGERIRVVSAAPASQPEVVPAVEAASSAEPRPRKQRSDRGVARGPRPPRAALPAPAQPPAVVIPSLGGDRLPAGFVVAFRHAGEESPRAMYVP